MNEPTIAVAATREGLRRATLDGIARALAHPRLLDAEAVRLLQAQRTFWQGADDATLEKLLAAY
jgi:hypothetical protein